MQLESLPGTILDQKYRIEKQLGKGAMGAVFQATHIGTTRPVALKVVSPKLARNPEFVQRFKREAEAAGRLNHPNVVNVTDFGVAPVENEDLAYLVMEYLDGQTLADHLKDDQRPAFPFVLDVIDQIGLALDAAHTAGIVHRDLKPSNVWLQPDRRGGFNVKVLDFGIAKVANPTIQERAIVAEAFETMVMTAPEPSDTLALNVTGTQGLLSTPSHLKTTVGALLGTPTYMAPEQCSGLEVDARADIYALGVISYQMLCGQVPFETETLSQLIQQQIQTAPPSPRVHDTTVPEALSAVVLSGLEKDPARRPPTAGTFAQRLRAASEGEISLIRQSKDTFHSHINPFMPVMFTCLSVVLLGVVNMRLAGWAAHARLLPAAVLFWLIAGGSALLMMFGFQLYKAACMLILRHASATGQFESAKGPVLRTLAAGLGTLLRTQFLSIIDLRPSSWRANILWPVVWAAEGRSGKDAMARSRELTNSVRWATLGLMVRQYAPALLAPMVFPTSMVLMDSVGGGLRFLQREVLSGSFFGFFTVIYPIILGMFYANYGPAFSFLYWSALRCRNEALDTNLPEAPRAGDRRTAARAVRPGTLIWCAIPLALVLLVVVRSSFSGARPEFEDAASEGRRTTVLKLLDSGVPVDQPTGGNETVLFDAVRGGDELLTAELLRRGANVNAIARDGDTPLLLAAYLHRNELARSLLEKGALVDATTRSGRTALMFAAMRGNAALARLLLDHGADPARRDNNGRTAADYASAESYADVAALLDRKPN